MEIYYACVEREGELLAYLCPEVGGETVDAFIIGYADFG